MARLNALMARNLSDDRFITFFYGVLDPVTMRFVYCNAGHNYPCVRWRSGDTEILSEGGGVAVGVMEDCDYAEAEVCLAKADSLLL